MAIRLNVILLNYKTPDLIVDCLRSIDLEDLGDGQVFVVDNASSDNSVEIINRAIQEESWGEWVSVIESDINGGFAAGNNLGIKADRADGYVLLNSDTLVKPGLFGEFRKAMVQNPDAGVIAPAIVDEQGRPDISAFRWLTPWGELLRAARLRILDRLFERHHVIFPLPESGAPINPDWVGFACVLIRHEVIEKVGFLDDCYFMYFEDVDYCRRVRQAGWQVLYWPKARIVHFLGASSGVSGGREGSKRAPEYYYRARSRYFRTYYGQKGLFLANLAWSIGAGLAFLRNLFMKRETNFRRREFFDNWIGFISYGRS